MALEAVSATQNQSTQTSAPAVSVPLSSPSQLDIERAKDYFSLAAFVVFNALLFKLLLQTAYYQAFAEELRQTFGFVELALVLVLVASAGRQIINEGFAVLHDLFLPKESKATGAAATVGYESLAQALVILIWLGLVIVDAVLDPQSIGQIVRFDSLPTLLFFITLSRWLDLRFKSRFADFMRIQTLDSSLKVRKIIPTSNQAKADFNLEWVALSQLHENDRFNVMQGETVLCDGVVFEGRAEVYERRLGPHAEIRFKNVGDEIYAGSEIVRGEVSVKATCLPHESTITNGEATYSSALRRSLQAGPSSSKFSRNFFLVLLVSALLVAWLSSIQGAAVQNCLMVALAVLIIQIFPKALALREQLNLAILPSALRRAIYLKDVNLIAALAATRKVLLDYNSNSKLDSCAVVDFELLDGRFDRDSLLNVAYVLMGKSYQDLDSRIAAYARSGLKQASLLNCQDSAVFPGLGVTGVVEGANITIGTESLLIERGVVLQTTDIAANSDRASYVYMAVETEVVGRFKICPLIDYFGAPIVERLNALDIEVAMLSDLPQALAETKARSMGISSLHVYGGLSPQDYISRFAATEDILFFASDLTENRILQHFKLSISNYDEQRCDLDRSQISFLKRDFSLLAEVFELISRLVKTERSILGFAAVLSILMFALAASHLISPVVVAMTMVVCSLYMYLSFERVVPLWGSTRSRV